MNSFLRFLIWLGCLIDKYFIIILNRGTRTIILTHFPLNFRITTVMALLVNLHCTLMCKLTFYSTEWSLASTFVRSAGISADRYFAGVFLNPIFYEREAGLKNVKRTYSLWTGMFLAGTDVWPRSVAPDSDADEGTVCWMRMNVINSRVKRWIARTKRILVKSWRDNQRSERGAVCVYSDKRLTERDYELHCTN